MSALTRRQRLEFRVGRLLSLLPPRMQVRLSGRPPVRIDGQTLEPEIQLLLSLLERRGRPPYEELSLPGARAEMRRGAIVGSGPSPEVADVRELTIPSAAGAMRARHYVPGDSGIRAPRPLLVFFHGGGFVLGDLDSHDAACRLLSLHVGSHVLSVDYRLAPEHPFPGAIEDGRAALEWALANAAQLGADAERVAVAGDSAGANVAAVATHEITRTSGRAPALQLLIYPVTDFASRSRSHELFEEGFLLIRRDMDWFSAQYVGEADPAQPRLSILRADDLSGLPPTIVVTAGFDPLRDEGEAYAVRLREAGVPVLLRRFPGLIHGFMNMVGVSRTSRDAIVEFAGAARAMLATLGTGMDSAGLDGDSSRERAGREQPGELETAR